MKSKGENEPECESSKDVDQIQMAASDRQTTLDGYGRYINVITL